MGRKKTNVDEVPVLEAEAVAILKKYKVQLPYLPSMKVDACDEKEAIENYNKMLGVRKTIHKHEVTLV